MKENIDMDNLIGKFLSGEAKPEEAIMLEDWKDETPENLSQFIESAAIYYPGGFPQSTIKEMDALRQFKSKVGFRGTYTKKISMIWPVAAASIVVALGCIFWLITFHPDEKGIRSFTLGRSNIIKLEDGSKVVLFADALLEVDGSYNRTHRKVKFRGSAEFYIRHFQARPMVIDMDHFFIKDLGTKFTVVTSKNSDTIVVNVHEGSVLLYNEHGNVLKLSVSESGIYVKSAQVLSPIKPKTFPTVKHKVTPIIESNKDTTKIQPTQPINAVKIATRPIKADTLKKKPITKIPSN